MKTLSSQKAANQIQQRSTDPLQCKFGDSFVASADVKAVMTLFYMSNPYFHVYLPPPRLLGWGDVPNGSHDGCQPGSDISGSGSRLLSEAPVLPDSSVPDQIQSQHGSKYTVHGLSGLWGDEVALIMAQPVSY